MLGIMVPAIIVGIMPEAMLGDIPVMPEAMLGDIPVMPEAILGDIPVMPDAASPGAYMACVMGNCSTRVNRDWLLLVRGSTVAAGISCQQRPRTNRHTTSRTGTQNHPETLQYKTRE